MIKNILEKSVNALARFYKAIDKNEVISFIDYDEQSATIAFRGIKVYGIKVINHSNMIINKNLEYILNSLRHFQGGANVLLNIIRNEKENFVYVYSTNEEVIRLFVSLYGNEAIQMRGIDIIKSFKNYFFFNEYEIKNNELIDLNEKTIIEAIANKQFHYIANMASYQVLKENEVYQMVSYKETPMLDFYELMKAKWKGVLSVYFESSDNIKEAIFKEKKRLSNMIDDSLYKEYKKIENENLINELIEKTILTEAIFVGNSNDKERISSAIKWKFKPNYFNGDKKYRNTLFKAKELGFSYYLPLNHAENLFYSTKQKQFKKEIKSPDEWALPDVWGKDYSDCFINLCFIKSTNPHVLIIGETGSGKTTGLLNIIDKGMGFDEDFKSELLENELVGLRYFDIDNSAGGFINRVKKQYPDDVFTISSGIANFKINLLDVELNEYGKIDDITKNMIVSFVDMILKIANGNNAGLSVLEKNVFSNAVGEIVKKDFNFTDYTLEEINKNGGYEKILDELLEKGYSLHTKVSELPEEYSFLRKPTLKDVKSYINGIRNRRDTTQTEKEAMESLINKISYLEELGIFSFFSNFNIKEQKKILYIDATEIKNDPVMFVSIVWLMLNDIVKKDKKKKLKDIKEGKLKTKYYYVLEEAHNFLKVEAFKNAFMDYTKELRKYNIHLIFLIHNLENINVEMYKSIANKFFFFKSGTHDVVKREINTMQELKPEQEKVFDLVPTIERGIFNIHSDGVNALRFVISPKKLQAFRQEEVE